MLGIETLWSVIAVFAATAGVIAFAGARLARIADTLADRTQMGEVIAGALFVGASTSLPGAITSITDAGELQKAANGSRSGAFRKTRRKVGIEPAGGFAQHGPVDERKRT